MGMNAATTSCPHNTLNLLQQGYSVASNPMLHDTQLTRTSSIGITAITTAAF